MKQLHRILLPFAVVAPALSMAACASQGDLEDVRGELATAQAELTVATQRVATLEEQFTEAQAATAKGTIKLGGYPLTSRKASSVPLGNRSMV